MYRKRFKPKVYSKSINRLKNKRLSKLQLLRKLVILNENLKVKELNCKIYLNKFYNLDDWSDYKRHLFMDVHDWTKNQKNWIAFLPYYAKFFFEYKETFKWKYWRNIVSVNYYYKKILNNNKVAAKLNINNKNIQYIWLYYLKAKVFKYNNIIQNFYLYKYDIIFFSFFQYTFFLKKLKFNFFIFKIFKLKKHYKFIFQFLSFIKINIFIKNFLNKKFKLKKSNLVFLYLYHKKLSNFLYCFMNSFFTFNKIIFKKNYWLDKIKIKYKIRRKLKWKYRGRIKRYKKRWKKKKIRGYVYVFIKLKKKKFLEEKQKISNIKKLYIRNNIKIQKLLKLFLMLLIGSRYKRKFRRTKLEIQQNKQFIIKKKKKKKSRRTKKEILWTLWIKMQRVKEAWEFYFSFFIKFNCYKLINNKIIIKNKIYFHLFFNSFIFFFSIKKKKVINKDVFYFKFNLKYLINLFLKNKFKTYDVFYKFNDDLNLLQSDTEDLYIKSSVLNDNRLKIFKNKYIYTIKFFKNSTIDSLYNTFQNKILKKKKNYLWVKKQNILTLLFFYKINKLTTSSFVLFFNIYLWLLNILFSLRRSFFFNIHSIINITSLIKFLKNLNLKNFDWNFLNFKVIKIFVITKNKKYYQLLCNANILMENYCLYFIELFLKFNSNYNKNWKIKLYEKMKNFENIDLKNFKNFFFCVLSLNLNENLCIQFLLKNMYIKDKYFFFVIKNFIYNCISSLNFIKSYWKLYIVFLEFNYLYLDLFIKNLLCELKKKDYKYIRYFNNFFLIFNNKYNYDNLKFLINNFILFFIFYFLKFFFYKNIFTTWKNIKNLEFLNFLIIKKFNKLIIQLNKIAILKILLLLNFIKLKNKKIIINPLYNLLNLSLITIYNYFFNIYEEIYYYYFFFTKINIRLFLLIIKKLCFLTLNSKLKMKKKIFNPTKFFKIFIFNSMKKYNISIKDMHSYVKQKKKLNINYLHLLK